MTPRKLLSTLVTIGSLITYLIAILFSISLILLGIEITGTLTAITAQIIMLGSDNLFIILLISMVACYLLGMVGMALIPYIVLAVTAIPAIAVATGVPPLAIHLFVIFFLMSGGITPPVCVIAFTAAALAGARPMKTGYTAMRLAIVLYFVPWVFVYNPALILEGPITETIYLFALCMVGIFFVASGLEGYLLRVGRLEMWARPLFMIGGFMIAFPGWMTTIVGFVIAAVVIAFILITRKPNKEKLIAIST
jgi:TRAP-type uncharacterized transport system fused permease subunit